uniref:Uncharacterized protein n=1 Tax=Piliocolobus tephrosceles TaxID=591936 RepID=A0A8C9H4W3_9PRIM
MSPIMRMLNKNQPSSRCVYIMVLYMGKVIILEMGQWLHALAPDRSSCPNSSPQVPAFPSRLRICTRQAPGLSSVNI